MTKQWRVRVSGKPRKEPHVGMLVQAVLALAEQLNQERIEEATEPSKAREETS
jgi:hypothetical protein